MSERVPVVYIMGSGRSGSTVLDTILGNHPRAASFGELVHLARSGWANDEYCACGARARTCPFWNAVRARWEAEGGELEDHLALQARFERLRGIPLAHLPARRGGPRERWGRRIESLFRALRAESGRPVVVDSSKVPGRAHALARLPGLDVFLVHLVRDGRGVAWSLSKAHSKDERAGVQRDLAPRSVRRTAVSWTVVNGVASWVLRRRPPDRRALVRYEEYVEDPVGALAPVWEFLGGDGGLGAKLAAGELEVGHTIAGNRLRMAGRVRLRPDVEWRERMPADERRRFWRIAGGLMRRYGYAE